MEMRSCPRELKDLLKVIYKLSDSEIEVFYYLCSNKSIKVKNLAKKLGKSRSTTQRILKTLLSAGLVKRESQIYPGSKKGRYYSYSLAPKEELKERIKEKIKNWKEVKFEVLKSL